VIAERVYRKDGQMAGVLCPLGAFLAGTGRVAEAGPFLDRSVPILQRHFGATHDQTIRAVNGLAVGKTKEDPREPDALLRSVLKEWLSVYSDGASALTRRAIEINRKYYGPQQRKEALFIRQEIERAAATPGYVEPGRHSVDVRALRR
jgi:hypothetical protein